MVTFKTRTHSRLLSNILYCIDKNRWLLIALLAGLVLNLIPTPGDISEPGWRTLSIAVMVLILIVSEALPLAGVALFIAVAQVVMGIADSAMVASTFMSDAVFFIMGSLMLAAAIIHQGLDARLALGIIRITGNKTSRIMIGLLVISAILSSFIGSHTVVAMLLPVGMTLVRYTATDKKQTVNLSALLLFSIAYGATIGSVGTPSGGARNAIILGYWQDLNITEIDYLAWMKYVYPLLILELPFAVLVLRWVFKPEYNNLDSAVRKLKVKVAHSGIMTGQQKLSVFFFLLTFLGWITLSQRLGLGIIAIAGVLLYLAFGLVSWDDINRNTNWGVVLLFAAAISLGVQMRRTGTALWVADNLIGLTGDMMAASMPLRDAFIMIITTTMANTLSAAATVAILGPININLGGDPVTAGFITAISSAFGYFTATAAPATMIIYSSGMVRSKQFLRAGWRMGLVSMALLMLVTMLYWPMIR
ncbi:MAG: DASS family sodium-coupled anion symporter [Lentisphaeria bacterium]|nr:DASS family sodium-coupled anion symporter [Lentisphaeria bacterium]